MMTTEYTEAEQRYMDRNTYSIPTSQHETAPVSQPATSRPMARPKPYYKPKTQKGVLLAHFRAHGHITNIHAVQELKILRLSQRISEMEDDGFLIDHQKQSSTVWVYTFTGHESDRRTV